MCGESEIAHDYGCETIIGENYINMLDVDTKKKEIHGLTYCPK